MSIRAEVIEIIMSSSIVRTFASVSFAVAALTLGGSALASEGHASLTPAQKAQLEAPRRAEHAARAELNKALAAQIERGAIDRALLAPQVAAEKQARASLETAFESVLTAEQKAEMHKRREARQANEGERKHHERLNLTEEQKTQIRARMAGEPKGDRGVERRIDRYDAMAPVLTPAQRAELAATLRKEGAAR
jgi:Spy/CpxP family protein refolding chaperone